MFYKQVPTLPLDVLNTPVLELLMAPIRKKSIPRGSQDCHHLPRMNSARWFVEATARLMRSSLRAYHKNACRKLCNSKHGEFTHIATPEVIPPLDQKSSEGDPLLKFDQHLCVNWENVIKFRLLTDWTAAGVYVYPNWFQLKHSTERR